MNENQQQLSSLLKNAQRGQVTIRSILDTTMQPQLRSALTAQLREYESIESEALSVALQRGWELQEIDIPQRFLMDRAIRLKLSGRSHDSRIADILIQSNTKAMIRSLQNLHRFSPQDPQIRILSQKLLDCETAIIQKMQCFL